MGSSKGGGKCGLGREDEKKQSGGGFTCESPFVHMYSSISFFSFKSIVELELILFVKCYVWCVHASHLSASI